MRSHDRTQLGGARPLPAQSKPSTASARKPAYEQPSRPADRNPKQKENTSQRTVRQDSDNEFELIYKIKGNGKGTFPFDEESFESLLLLKSKNNIKRFSNKTKREEKSSRKGQPASNQFQSTSSGLGRSHQQQERKQKRADRIITKQESSRLGGVQSLDKNRSQGQRRMKSPKHAANRSRLTVGAGTSKVNETLKRTKSAEFQIKLTEVVGETKKHATSKQQVKKSHRNSNPDLRVTRSQVARPKHQTTKSRIQPRQEKCQHAYEEEYIMLDNQIYPAELNELEGELSSMMVHRPTEIRLINHNAGEMSQIHDLEETDEDFYSIRQYYDEKATLIQKVFRGYLVRKYVKLYKKQLRRSGEKEPQKKQSQPESKSNDNPASDHTLSLQLCPTLNDEPDILVMPSREDLKETQIIPQPALKPSTNTPVTAADKFGSILNEFQKLAGEGQMEQLLLKMKQFVKEKELSKPNSDRQKEAKMAAVLPCPKPVDDVAQTLIVRENAVEMRLNTQHNVLKKLLADGKLQSVDYDRRLVSVEKWAHNERQEIHRLRQLLRANIERAAEIVKKAQEDITIVERVNCGEEKQTELEKILNDIPASSDGFFFYSEEPEERPKATGWHGNAPPKRSEKQLTELQDPSDTTAADEQTDHSYNTNLKEIIEGSYHSDVELKERQRVKGDIDLRIATQMSYIKPVLTGPSAINTSMQAMHHFLSNFFRFVECYYRHEFLRMINMPYGYSPERRLRFLQGYDYASHEETILEDGMVEGVEKVIGTDIFAEFHEQYYVRDRAMQNEQSTDDEKAVLYDSIHNRAVFDGFNEALNLFRPYYLINGPPYLWNISEKALTFYFIAEENIEEVFEKTKYKVMKWASTLCGLQLPEYETAGNCKLQDLVDGKSGCHKMLAECRQERLLKSLKHNVSDTDYQWSMFEEQRTDIMLDLSTILLNRLLQEVAIDVLSFY